MRKRRSSPPTTAAGLGKQQGAGGWRREEALMWRVAELEREVATLRAALGRVHG